MAKSLSFTDVDKSFHSLEFLTWQICLKAILKINSHENFGIYSNSLHAE